MFFHEILCGTTENYIKYHFGSSNQWMGSRKEICVFFKTLITFKDT